jgi:hypothetical protein
MEMNKGAAEPGTNRGTTQSHAATASSLADLNISKTQSSRWQKLADVPEDEFERTLADPAAHPSTTSIIEEHAAKNVAATPTPQRADDPVDEDARWLWGQLLNFERLLGRDPRSICETMLPHMTETVRELAPRVGKWLMAIE